MVRVKFIKINTHERTHKHTSIGGGRIKTSSMNKYKRRSYKKYNRSVRWLSDITYK